MNIHTLLLSLLTVIHIACYANTATKTNPIPESVQIHCYQAGYLAQVMESLIKAPHSSAAPTVSFKPDPETNSIIITGDADTVILDIPSPIVTIEVFTGEAKDKIHQETLEYLKSLL